MRTDARTVRRRVCPQCGEEFTIDLSRKRTFCAAECRTASRRSEAYMETRPCPVCDNPFQAGKTVRTVYFSMACRREAEHRSEQVLDEEQIDGSARRRHPHRRLGSGSPTTTGPPGLAAARRGLRPAGTNRDPELPALSAAGHHHRAAGHPRSRPTHHAPVPERRCSTAADSMTAWPPLSRTSRTAPPPHGGRPVRPRTARARAPPAALRTQPGRGDDHQAFCWVL